MISNKYNLQLRVSHQHGMKQQAMFNFREDTVLGKKQFSEFFPETERASLADMQCTVFWRAIGAMGGGWWLLCNSQSWLCAVNDMPLEYQRSVPLHSGDRIELGMLQLEVIDVDKPSFIQSRDLQSISLDAVNAGATATALPLTQLGSIAVSTSLSSLIRGKHDVPSFASRNDPFDIVPAAVARNSGAEATPSAQPFLSDQDIINGKHLDPTYIAQAKTDLPKKTCDAQASPIATGSVAENPADVQSNGGAVALKKIDCSILDQLARDYIQAIQDPNSVHDRHGMHAMPKQDESILSTPAELAASIPQHVSIEDVVSGEMTIDSLVQQIGRQEWTLPSAASEQDVLHLFADGIVIPRQRANLPSLTRREHHAFSPDSSYLAASASRYDTERSASPNSKDSDHP